LALEGLTSAGGSHAAVGGPNELPAANKRNRLQQAHAGRRGPPGEH